MTDLLQEINRSTNYRPLTVLPTEVTRTDNRTREEIHASAMARGAKCERCPLYGLHVGPVASVIVSGQLGAIGDAPIPVEIISGVPMSGNGGTFMNEHLEAVGVSRSTLSIINVTECKAPEGYAEWRKKIVDEHKTARSNARKNKLPTPSSEIPLTPEEACSGRFQHDVKAAQASGVNTFLVLGNNALRAYAGAYKIPIGGKVKAKPGESKITTLKKSLGCVMEFPDAPTIIPSYQPLYGLMKGSREYSIGIGRWIRRAGLVSQRSGKTSWKAPARLITNPTVDQVEDILGQMIDRAWEHGAPVYCDIETDGINVRTAKVLCIAFGQRGEDGEWTVITVPWRRTKGVSTSKGGGNGGEHWYSLAAPKPPTDVCSTDAECAPTLLNALAQYVKSQSAANPSADDGPYGLDYERSFQRKARPAKRVMAEFGSPAQRVFAAMRLLINDPRVELVGHNFNGFDAPKLYYAGLLDNHNRAFRCTMQGTKNSYACDMPKSLVFACALRFEVTEWKSQSDDKYIVGATDEHLRVYCAFDVVNTGELDEHERAEHSQCGTIMQNETDMAVSAVYKNMGDLGLMADMQEQARISVAMRDARKEHFRKLAQLTWHITSGATELKHIEEIDEWFPGTKFGLPNSEESKIRFHPESADMVCEILFGRRKHKPLVGLYKKDGEKVERPYEQGDKISVTAGSLIKLRDHLKRVDETTKQPLNRDSLATQFIDALLEYRAFTKITSTYIEGLVRPRGDKGVRTCHHCGYKGVAYFGNCQRCGSWLDDTTIMQEDDGYYWLHPNYKLLIPTGRASANPTIQTYPERGKLNCRRGFIAPPGHIWVAADLDQVELRLYAIIAGDQPLIDVINWRGDMDPKTGKRAQIDAHSWNYATIKAKDPNDHKAVFAIYQFVEALGRGGEADKQMRKMFRNIAKRFVYLIMYGGEVEKLFETMRNDRDKESGELMFPGLLPDETERWFNNWHNSHPATKLWQAACINAAKRDGYVTSPIIDYRRRFFPGQREGLNQQNAAANSVIQPSASAITNRAAQVVASWWKHREWSRYSGLNLQIHDALGGYCPIERAEYVRKRLTDSMYFKYNGMEFTAEGKYGLSWAVL